MAFQTWLYALISVVIVSLISFVGIFMLSFRKKFLEKILLFLVSFAVGALIGDAFLHLLPEAIETGIRILTFGFYALIGFIIFFIIEKFLRFQHRHLFEHKGHKHKHEVKPYVYINLFGDGIHNFIDGMIIAGSYLINIPLGIATTLAVIFHEVAQEIGDFAILIKGGLTRSKALFFNFLSALSAVLGGIITLLVGVRIENLSNFLVPFTFAGFLYIAMANLIPELHHEETSKKLLIQIAGVFIGIAIMVLLLFLE